MTMRVNLSLARHCYTTAAELPKTDEADLKINKNKIAKQLKKQQHEKDFNP